MGRGVWECDVGVWLGSTMVGVWCILYLVDLGLLNCLCLCRERERERERGREGVKNKE